MPLKGPLLSAENSQDNTWCSVGPSGRHKHWQPAQGCAAASMNSKPAGGCAAPSMNPKFDLPLASLPGPAIASIFHRLDIYSSHQLALTCQACAREAAYHRNHNKTDCCAKILPKVQSTVGGEIPFPVGILNCAWTGSSSDALPYVHTMSQQPEFLSSMWKAAWSTVPHSFYADLRSMTGHAMDTDWGGCDKLLRLTIYLAIHSTTPLHVSLAWLQAFCETAKATLIEKFFIAVAGYVDSVMDITCRVFRPQGPLQEDEWVSQSSADTSPQGGPWKFVCQYPHPRGWCNGHQPVAPKPEYSIAVTGMWCEYEGKVSHAL